MTDRQESVLSMYIIFDAYISKYDALTTPLPKFSENHLLLKEAIPQIQSFAELQKSSSKGITKEKNRLRKNLMIATIDNANKLKAYAEFTGNVVLKQKVSITTRAISNTTDTGVRDYGMLIYDLGQENISAIESYEITPASQTSFMDKIESYRLSIGKPGISRAERKKITYCLKVLFNNANKAIYLMDSAIEIIRLRAPEFYVGYKSARKVIETQSSTIVLKGVVRDRTTGLPLRNVSLLFVPENGDSKTSATSAIKPVVVKKTALKGGYSVRKLPAGVYTVFAKMNGYAEQNATITIGDGKKTVLNFKLVKI